MGRINNVISIPTSLQGNFFRLWLEFLGPFHGLTNREIDIATAFLKKRFELSQVITDEEVLDKVLMNEDSRREIKKNCKMSAAQFQVIIGKLRKSKILLGNKVNPKFIPKGITPDSKNFNLMLYFDLNDNRAEGSK